MSEHAPELTAEEQKAIDSLQSDGATAWVVAMPNYDSYEVIAIFTDRDQAEAVWAELDLTPTGKQRGHYSIDAYPLNPRTAQDAARMADVL
jgi:hypothetical protein